MRWLGLVVLWFVSTASAAGAAPRWSNPAFLGIQMNDGGGRGPCMIDLATRESPAEAAGLRPGDVVMSIDGKPIATCDVLLAEITAHAPGDTVDVRVKRGFATIGARVQLTTRDALLHKVIGKPMVETNFVGVEDGTLYDLSAPHGRMAIVGLYDPSCVDCAALFTKFLDWSREKTRKGWPEALVLAVITGDALPHDLKALQSSLDVPLATGEFVAPERDRSLSPFGRERVLFDHSRLGVIVIDGRGIVQYIGPIAPNSDDTEAVLDELFAAADQAAHRSK